MRRTKEEAEKTRQEIMKAAIKVMNEKGLSSTRFEDIAKEANVTRGAIYHYFKSKNEILFAVHLNTKKQIIELFERHVSEDIDPAVSIKSGLRDIFQKFINDKQYRAIEELFLKAEFASLIKNDEELSKLFEKEKEETYCEMLGLLKRGKEMGSFRNDIKPENLTRTVVSFYIGFVTMWFLREHDKPEMEYVEDYINILLHGILK